MLSTVFFIAMRSVIMLSVIMPSVVMLSVVAPGSGYVTVCPFLLGHIFTTNSGSLWGSTPKLALHSARLQGPLGLS